MSPTIFDFHVQQGSSPRRRLAVPIPVKSLLRLPKEDIFGMANFLIFPSRPAPRHFISRAFVLFASPSDGLAAPSMSETAHTISLCNPPSVSVFCVSLALFLRKNSFPFCVPECCSPFPPALFKLSFFRQDQPARRSHSLAPANSNSLFPSRVRGLSSL